MKKYAEQSEAKKKTIKIKRGPKKLNFGASKPGVRGGGRAPPGSASVISSLVSPCVINRVLALQSKLSSNDNWGKWGFHCRLVAEVYHTIFFTEGRR